MKHALIAAGPNQPEPSEHNKCPTVEVLFIDHTKSALSKPPKRWPKWFHPSSESYGDYGDDKVGFFD